ncbi:hypothetical protein F5X71_25120 [Nocardia brasiliensis]|uniref:Uncharacterized protein n=1 Tax=Nocardia brasiliensis TaxID=37326 RepID=A0A6G9XW68_NOCBR|nr:hypothetical protein [Nocardia brasiliensis]QIS05159.1 hypothetical protein F5X71_25120 [Nocardia brasiliensis]
MNKDACESLNFGGEWEESADNLLAALFHEKPSITRDEYIELSALSEAVGSHVDGLDYLARRVEILENLTVAD